MSAPYDGPSDDRVIARNTYCIECGVHYHDPEESSSIDGIL